MYIGPHVPLNDTFLSTVTQMKDSPYGLIQIFMGPPIGYHIRRTTDEVLEKTGKFLGKNNKKLYVHAPYVINLASQDETILSRGRKSIQKILDTQSTINNYGVKDSKNNGSLTGTVLHIGAKGPLSQVINEINDLSIEDTENTENSTKLYLENAAQNKLGNTWDDLRKLCEGIDSQNVGFCIDTCHTHSSGLANMRDPEEVVKLFDDLDMCGKSGKSGKPVCIHLNDSKTKFKSKQDIHSVLGYGSIWDIDKPESFESLHTLLDICKAENYDIILETPYATEQLNYEFEIFKSFV
jgi:deoxyribonuclease-4